jgi:phage RecT family recombinase
MTKQNGNGQVAKRQPSPVDRLKMQLSTDSVQEQFRNTLKENAGAFTASVIDLYGSDKYLQQCNPNQVIMECLKAATLKLPINKQLGFAYIVPNQNAICESDSSPSLEQAPLRHCFLRSHADS